MTPTTLVRRTDLLLRSDPRRVVARLFLPGQEVAVPGNSRASGVIARCLALTDEAAAAALDHVLAAYGDRHRDFPARLEQHFTSVAHRVAHAESLSPARRRLLGAYFTQEFSLEAAALFNPSIVAHPRQNAGPQQLRFVMSARAVGEGHVSSVVFRTGVLDVDASRNATVSMDAGSIYATTTVPATSRIDRERLRRESAAEGADPESLAFVLAELAESFSPAALHTALDDLTGQHLTRVHAEDTSAILRMVASRSYELSFPSETELSERVLMPETALERQGIEDARFVQFTDDDGSRTYLATYTAFDGAQIAPRRLQTDDFRTFHASPFTGPAAQNKGMALFPRRVGGRFLALSRWDRENNAIAYSDDGHDWQEARRLQVPERSWELIQLGNCGSPLETPQGWVVLTHGVGAMREYSLGALLLDLDDPARVIGRLVDPLLTPTDDERDGYVPNVVYSCGALLHGQTLLLPYGCSDSTIRFAFIDLPGLLERLLEPSARSAGDVSMRDSAAESPLDFTLVTPPSTSPYGITRPKDPS